jgi:hypothetical protein
MVELLSKDDLGALSLKSIDKYDTDNRNIENIQYNYELKFGALQQIPTEKTTYEYEEY